MKSRGLNLLAEPTSTVSQRTFSPNVPAVLWSSNVFGGGSRSPLWEAASRCTAMAAGVRRTASSTVGATTTQPGTSGTRTVAVPPASMAMAMAYSKLNRSRIDLPFSDCDTLDREGFRAGRAVALRTEPRQAVSRPCGSFHPYRGRRLLLWPRRVFERPRAPLYERLPRVVQRRP